MSSNSTVTDPAAAAAIAAAIKEASYYIKMSQFLFCAVYSVVLWDWMTSLPREWRLIWKTRWSVIKVLYLMCRYYVILVMPYVIWVFVADHSLDACKKLFRSPVALAMWNQFWAETILLIRTYAFLGNKLPVLIFLCVCLAGVVGYQLYVDTSQLALLPFLDPANGGPCFPTTTYDKSPHVMAFFLASLLFDLVVTILTIWRAIQHRTLSGGTGSPLLKTFVSEGIYYFVLISCANLINAIFYWQPKAVMSALLVPFSTMIPDILACRMVLDLRDRGVHHTSNHATSNQANQGGSNQLTARKVPVTNKRDTFTPGRNNGSANRGNVQHHELDTFHRDVSEGDVKSVPLDMIDEETGTVHSERSLPHAGQQLNGNAIRVDIERHQYYEDDDRSSVKEKQGGSFMS